jgi:AcrR family transcriptional regulator
VTDAADDRDAFEPGRVTRRAPFSDNPRVGARGQRTQQRILDAALRVFGEEGYYQCSIDRIAKQAGCSRVSFYQYFGSKEDVFRHLAGQVARQLLAATESLDPLTPDVTGWNAVRTWVARHADIYERYEPVFRAFETASETDEAVAVGSARWGERHVARFRSSVAATALPPRQLDPLIALLLESQYRTLDVASILRARAPDAYPSERVQVAIADVFHRSLFGVLPTVNVHPPANPRPPAIPFDAEMWELFRQGDAAPDVAAGRKRTLSALMQTGRDVFLQRGYYGTRVDDLVAAAGVSHGAFYRYFKNKDELARILVLQAMRSVGTVFGSIPSASVLDGANGRATLRRWLRQYNETHVNEAAMIRVWLDAALQDAKLRADSAPEFDWGRRRMAHFLASRGFGDTDTEAIFMVALLSTFGTRERSSIDIDAAAHIIECGLLGRD